MQEYHGLRVWKNGQDFVVAVHQVVARFPRRGASRVGLSLITHDAQPDTPFEAHNAQRKAHNTPPTLTTP